MLAMPKSCSSMTWRFQSVQMKNWMLNKEALLSSWNETQVVQKSWQPFLLKRRWPSLWITHRFALRLVLPILPRITASVFWSKLITLVQAMILKASMKLWQDQINQQLLGKILKIHNTNKPLSACMMMSKEWPYPIKDCTSMKFLETILWL